MNSMTVIEEQNELSKVTCVYDFINISFRAFIFILGDEA